MTASSSFREASDAPPETRARGERAYDEIRDGILKGDLPIGSVLAETQLASQLGISRTPVRQALRRLLQEGLVEIGPRRQMVVCSISPERRTEIFLIRQALECTAIKRACESMREEEIDLLWLLLIRQRRAAETGKVDQFMEIDEELHLRLAAGAELPLLVKILEQLGAFVHLMGLAAVISRKDRMFEVLKEHEEIVKAVDRRDEKAAIEALRAHLRATEVSLAAASDAS